MLVSGRVYPVYRKLWWSKRIWRKQITYVFKTIAWLCWKSRRVILFLPPLNSTHHTIRVEIPSKHISLRDSKKRYMAQTDGAKVTWILKFWTKSSLLPRSLGPAGILEKKTHSSVASSTSGGTCQKDRNADFVLQDGAWVTWNTERIWNWIIQENDLKSKHFTKLSESSLVVAPIYKWCWFVGWMAKMCAVDLGWYHLLSFQIQTQWTGLVGWKDRHRLSCRLDIHYINWFSPNELSIVPNATLDSIATSERRASPRWNRKPVKACKPSPLYGYSTNNRIQTISNGRTH